MTSRRVGTSGVIEAAGGLLWRPSPEGPRLAVIHRQRYDDWTLPKGWREKGERYVDTAVREVAEETGCRAQETDFAGCTSYALDGMPKVVLYWHMSLLEERPFVANEETDALRWLPVAEALATLSYAGERRLVRSAARSLDVKSIGERNET
jgi:8-oxo-dGTP diphosphatase